MENFQGVWIRIRIRFVLRGWIRIRFVREVGAGSGSGQYQTGSATLLVRTPLFYTSVACGITQTIKDGFH